MAKIDSYLLKSFWPIFFTIFSVLFLITSIIIIISIANITSNIHITSYELFKMYLLSLPKVIFITISVSFFISSVSLFAKHSETQELIAIFAAGIAPQKLLKPFLLLAWFFTIINIFILFISIPYAKVAFINFKIQKQQEAKFNFQTSQVSQKFGEWNIFATSKNQKNYINLVLYNNKTRQLILADKANLHNLNAYLKFTLQNGNVYSFKDDIVINFKKMTINQKIPKKNYSIFNFAEYFDKFKELFIFYLPFALIPVILIFYVPYIAVFHPRIDKNRSLIYALVLLSAYLIMTKISSSIIVTLAISVTFMAAGYYLYKRMMKF